MVGLRASLLWRWAFLTRIPSWYRRTTLLFDWLSTAAFPRDVTQVRIGRSGAVLPMRYAAGEVIVRQGEPGGRFYVITDGEVEVVKEQPDGGEVTLARLGPGRYFGEIALMRATRRTATVRAVTDVGVLGIARRDFTALVEHLPQFRDALAPTGGTAGREGGGSSGTGASHVERSSVERSSVERSSVEPSSAEPSPAQASPAQPASPEADRQPG